tara:strand:+ start:2348 stop:2620 length:273 start_codon:yes stop_codon:yes gene_type:complete
MEQLELFKKLDYVLFGLNFEMPEPGCFAWYKESDEDYLNPRSGYCYVEKLNDDYNFVCYDDENDRHLVLRHHEIKRVDELRRWTPKELTT